MGECDVGIPPPHLTEDNHLHLVLNDVYHLLDFQHHPSSVESGGYEHDRLFAFCDSPLCARSNETFDSHSDSRSSTQAELQDSILIISLLPARSVIG